MKSKPFDLQIPDFISGKKIKNIVFETLTTTPMSIVNPSLQAYSALYRIKQEWDNLKSWENQI